MNEPVAGAVGAGFPCGSPGVSCRRCRGRRRWDAHDEILGGVLGRLTDSELAELQEQGVV